MAGIILAQQPLRRRSAPRESDSSLLLSLLNAKCRSITDDFAPANNAVANANTSPTRYGARFNGSSSALTVTDTAALRQAGDWTIAYWFRIESNRDFDRHFAKHSTDGVHAFSRATGATQITVNGDDGDVTSQEVIASTAVGQWYRLVIVNDADVGVKVYVDGEIAHDGTTPCGDASVSSDLILGTFAGTYMDGDIFDFRYYSDARNAEWAAADFAVAVPDPTLVLAVDGTGVDRSRYGLGFTPQADAIVGGKWITLDGTGDYLLNSTANWRSGDSAGTIIAWVRRSAVGSVHAILGSSDQATTQYFFVLQAMNTNELSLRLNQAGSDIYDLRGSTSIVANQWFHVAFTADGSTTRGYVNGAAETLTPSSGTNNGSWLNAVTLRDNVTVGALRRTSVVNNYAGDIGGVWVYDEAKAQAYIDAHYKATRGRF